MNCLRRHVLTKQDILLGKGSRTESRREAWNSQCSEDRKFCCITRREKPLPSDGQTHLLRCLTSGLSCSEHPCMSTEGTARDSCFLGKIFRWRRRDDFLF
ncbi:unnamed protein product [Rangifer tarandus platyrhynchus]|uniref:Uncharacterized protein n=2 Tax=Rangifer tarandus platyrhynchus TaxID=3082113 RepID=A0AC59ZJ70_RANTA|nr:unnamed protein product [Rangifer tarandus platyrhynchus]